MKTIWKLASVVAIVNLLMLLGTVGWLMASGRLDRDRWLTIRAILASPHEAAPAAPPPAPPEEPGVVVPTSTRIDARMRADQQLSMALRRLRDEKAQLDRALEERRAKLDSGEEALRAEKAAWDATTSGVREAQIDEQFRKTVKLLESVPPKQGKELLLALVAEGEVDQVVAYLDAMSPYKASGVLKAFKGEEENRVATDLLERLRRRGERARSAGSAPSLPNESAPASTLSPAGAPASPIANGAAEVDRPAGG